MSGKIDFYTNPMSRGGIVRWMLEEVGAEYELHLLQYGPEMSSPGYLAINPMGKVPAIVHQDHVVTEAAAICAYLADTFPDMSLAPTSDERAPYYRWMFFAAGPLEQAATSKSLGWFPKDKMEEGRVGFGSFERTLSALEQWVAAHDYICGDRFTAADVYVGAQVDWGLHFGTLPDSPAFTAYANRLRSRNAYQKAKALDGELMTQMDKA